MFEVNNTAVVISAILFIISVLYIYSRYKLSYWQRCGVKSLPTNLVFGNFKDTFTFRKPPGQVIQEIYDAANNNDPYVGFYVFHQPKLLLRDFNLMKQLMIKDFDVFPNRCFGGETEKDSIRLINLLGIHQPRWKYLRQKLTPSVTGLKLRRMVPLIEECGVPLLKYIENSKAGLDGWKKLELKSISSKYSTDVIASLAFGITTNSFDQDSITFWEAGQKILSGAKRGIILIILFFLPGLIKFIENYMVEPAKYFRTIFWDSMNTREKNGIKRNDLVDHFINLKNQEQMPDYKFEGDNLLAQAVSFYVAGFEATSTAIAFSLYELSHHPEYEECLYQEIKNHVRGKQLSVDLIKEMTFLDQVVNEALRLYPPLPIVDRVAVRDYKLPSSDVIIKKGTPVYISLNGTNRDPKYFDRPNEFIPTRTYSETEDLPSSSFAFGLGPRSCIGQRLGLIITKMALIMILKEYALSNERKEKTVLKPITIFTAAADGVYVKLKKRQ
ncbi:cytochrome P450 6k1-like [Phymastichus coffea]|uniref:cytochrome P450 6k1-like n=1 Tax=Phymastichus coffea TaxID=108790 RepID=UPI00273BC3C2|nr:cytochrome P450 6k1-like [Phymastichus coffea]